MHNEFLAVHIVRRRHCGLRARWQVGVRTFGRVHVTDLRDAYTAEPLKGIPDGQLVCARVLSVKGDRLDLSLRKSRGGCEAAPAKAPAEV